MGELKDNAIQSFTQEELRFQAYCEKCHGRIIFYELDEKQFYKNKMAVVFCPRCKIKLRVKDTYGEKMKKLAEELLKSERTD